MLYNKSKSISIAYWTAFASLLLLTILSLIAYKERTLFVDSSWFLVHIISQKTFYFMEMRFGAFITQLGTVAAVYTGMPMTGIMMIFSVSFYLFYLAAALLIGIRWQQKQLAILFSFYLLLFISDGFFCTVGEIFQGLAWMFLFFALYFQKRFRHNIFSVFLLLSFAFLSLICHVIVLFPFSFLWLYLNLEYSSFKDLMKEKKFWIYSILLLLLGCLRYYVSTLGWYDSAKLSSVHDISFSSFFAAFHSEHARTFAKLLLQNYWITLFLFIAGLVLLAKNKRYLQLGLTLLFTLVYFALVCVVYPGGYDRNMLFYFENEWAPLSVILSAPFVFQIFNTRVKPKLVLGIFVFLFAVRLLYVYDAYRFFNHRLENLSQLTTQLYEDGIYKAIIVAEEQQARDYLVMTWGTPIESMMLSKINGHEPAVSFKIVQKDFTLRQVPDSFYSNFNVTENSFLDRKYFLIDSIGDYQLIEGLDDFRLKSKY